MNLQIRNQTLAYPKIKCFFIRSPPTNIIHILLASDFLGRIADFRLTHIQRFLKKPQISI